MQSITESGKKHIIIPKDLFETQASFNGNEITEKIVSEINNFKLEDSLPLPGYFVQNIPQDIMNQKFYTDYGSEELSIKQINQLTNNLTSLFIQNGVDSECSLENTCAAILIECSRTLSLENKLSCVLLATSLARAFNSLEMPYSVLVFADYKFQFEIKRFDEKHSDDIIQRILDCVMVERFAPRISDACYFAKQTMVCPNRSNRAFFIISDGLDPYMNYIDDWKKNILNDNRNSFAFFTIYSKYLNNNQIEIVKKMWDKFNDGVSNAASFTRLIEFTGDSLFSGNANISIRPFLEKFKNLPKETHVYEFKRPVEYNEGIDKLAIEHAKSSIKSHFYDEIRSFYIKNDAEYEITEKIFFPSFQIPSNFLVNNQVEDDSILNELKKDIKSFQNARNHQLIDFVFVYNMASLKVQPTTTPTIDIPALIKHCILNDEEKNLFLEENSGIIRQYRAMVVIDASNSCFNDLMYNHSMQTIVTFLSTLATIKIPYFDLIVATSDGPLILAINQNTQTCLNPNCMNFWASLLSALERHDNKCNLYDAVLYALKLKTTSISAKKSYLFVFTDGLYDEDQQATLKNLLLSCNMSGINVFGIGIGNYPKRIERIFQKCLWSINPAYVITALSTFFGYEAQGSLKEIQLLEPIHLGIAQIKEFIINICEKGPQKIVYKALYKYLNDQSLYRELIPDNQ